MARHTLVGLIALGVLGALAAGAAFLVARGASAGIEVPAGDRAPAGVALPVQPGRPLHILIVGTSGVARGTWPDELEAAIHKCRAEVSVERLARAGANSEWGEAALARRLAPGAGPMPSIVVVEFAGNDSRLWRGMSPAASEARHARMIAAIRSAGAVPYLSTLSRVFGRERLERPFHAHYQAMYRALADRSGAGLVDTAADWQALEPAQARGLVPDGAHFTADAARRLIVPGFVRALAPAVCNLDGP